jgi:hypothetical protein
MLAFERFATKIDIVSCGCIPKPFRIMITYRVESPVRAGSRREGNLSQAGVNRRCEPLTVLIHSRTGRLAQCIFLLRTDDGGGVLIIPSAPEGEVAAVPVAATVTRSAFFGSSARGTCRQRRHLGRRGRRDMSGRDARRSTDRPTRAGSLSAPQACLLRLRPSAATSRRHQRPGAPSAATRPAPLPPPLTLGIRRWHKLNSTPLAETDQRRSSQARAARRPQLPHALRRAEWPLPGRRQSAAGQVMKGRSGSPPAVR